MEVEAVGASVPGIAHQQDGTVWAPNIAGWERYPLRDVLRAEVGNSCQVVMENDRASSILAEVSRGVARVAGTRSSWRWAQELAPAFSWTGRS